MSYRTAQFYIFETKREGGLQPLIMFHSVSLLIFHAQIINNVAREGHGECGMEVQAIIPK